MAQSRLGGVAAVLRRGVCAGTIASNSGNASDTPIPRSTVRRERCFRVTNITDGCIVSQTRLLRQRNAFGLGSEWERCQSHEKYQAHGDSGVAHGFGMAGED